MQVRSPSRLPDEDSPVLPADHDAALTAALAALERAGEALLAAVAVLRLATGAGSDEAPTRAFGPTGAEKGMATNDTLEADDELVPLATAAQRVKRDKAAVRRWTTTHGLGRKEGGRWYVDVSRLELFLTSGPHHHFK